MTTKRKKPAREPSDITTDKTETLAKGDDVAAERLASIAERTPTMAAVANAVHAGWVHEHEALGPCPTCGTAKTGNRCDVCGHQEHDT